jgi:hypothetical protein
MFRRKIDPDESRKILELLARWLGAVDRLKESMDSAGAAASAYGGDSRQFVTAHSAAVEAVENIRKEMSDAESWPAVRDRRSQVLLADFRANVDEAWRLAAELLNVTRPGGTDEVIANRITDVKRTLDLALYSAARASGKLTKRYKIRKEDLGRLAGGVDEVGPNTVAEFKRAMEFTIDSAKRAAGELTQLCKIAADEFAGPLGTTAEDRSRGIIALKNIIGLTAALCTKEICDGWSKFTGESEMPWESTWVVRVETLGFFLHLLGRWGHASDPVAIFFLHDAIVRDSCRDLVEHSWQPPFRPTVQMSNESAPR